MSLLLVVEADPVGDHDAVGITEVFSDALHGGRALRDWQRGADEVHVGRLRGNGVLTGDGGIRSLGDYWGGAANSVVTRKVLQGKVQEVKCNKCNMDAADKQALNTHTNQIFQWKNLIYLNNPLLYPSVTSYLLLLLRAGCLTGLSLWADGLFNRFLGRPEERV